MGPIITGSFEKRATGLESGHATQSGDEGTNHEATASSTLRENSLWNNSQLHC